MTEDDVSSLQYFVQVNGDPTRWAQWEEKQNQVARDYPAFMFAWLNYQQAKRTLRETAQSLCATEQKS